MFDAGVRESVGAVKASMTAVLDAIQGPLNDASALAAIVNMPIVFAQTLYLEYWELKMLRLLSMLKEELLSTFAVKIVVWPTSTFTVWGARSNMAITLAAPLPIVF